MTWLDALMMMPRHRKRRMLQLIDALTMVVSLNLAVMLHRDTSLALGDWHLWGLTSLVTVATLLCFHWLGIYRLVLRYMNHSAVLSLGAGSLISSLLVLIVDEAMGGLLSVSVAVIHGLALLVAVGGVRYSLRELYLVSQRRQRRPVVIYGAGAAGCELVSALRHGGEYEPVAFIDDWRGLEGTLVDGLRVHQPSDLELLVDEYRAAMVLLAIPSATRCRRREILQRLSKLSIPVQTIPGSADVIAGHASISELRDVALEELLGRDPVPQFPDLMDANIRGKSVMVTGAGGSIGSELCRQIVGQQPARLLLVDNCEFALFSLEQELQIHPGVGKSGVEVLPLLASIQQRDALVSIFDGFEVHTVYHAAAYKHVPLVEHNLIEGIRNNVFGTLNLTRAAMSAGVETFVMVSTDKAVRPTNVMGASKRLTELICQAFAHGGCSTRFCMVRFGNVLGSSGSVVPRFREQIERGGPVKVTHPEITRYFMTIPEAAQLVIQAGAMARGGEVFVLDMGEPVRIQDLATNMIRLSGLEVKDSEHPEGDVEIIHTGLRPGEKLFEELLIGEAVSGTRHDRIMTSREPFWEWPRLEAFLQELGQSLGASDHLEVRRLLMSAPLAYLPVDSMVDLVWQAQSDRLTAPGAPAVIETETMNLSDPVEVNSYNPV